MKLYQMLLLGIFIGFSLVASDLQIAIQAKKYEQIPIGLVFVGKKDKRAKVIVDRLQKNLQYSEQCKINSKWISKLKTVSELKKLFSQDINLTLFITFEEDQYIWRLYDLFSIEMLQAGRVPIENQSDIIIAHKLSDQIWPVIMGSASSFNSKIAYCKQIWGKKYKQEKPYKQIWIADFDGSNARLFIDIPTVSFAPRWSLNEMCPLLFYSENTLSNVQLVMSNMFNKRQVLCCFDGLNMQPTFSNNGKEVVFCLSKDGSSQLYRSYVDEETQKRKCERLTFNEGNNIGPCFIDDNRVAFVSDFETRRPQIYIMNIPTRELEKLTDGRSYCACPAYCVANNKLIYSKMIDGTMQLCEYDFAKKQCRQLTQGYGSKEEPSWSACGNYVIFGMNEGMKSRIAQLNLLTGKTRYLTSADDHCTYPSCSPVYQKNIGVLA